MGCYPQAFPLQLDLQLSLVVPILAVLTYRAPNILTLLLSTGLICANLVINFCLTYHYGFKIGFMNVKNYWMMEKVIAKPWCHSSNVGHGILLAHFYRNLVKYRQETDPRARAEKFPFVHRLYKGHVVKWGPTVFGLRIAVRYSTVFIGVGLAMFGVNMVCTFPF